MFLLSLIPTTSYVTVQKKFLSQVLFNSLVLNEKGEKEIKKLI